MIVLLTAYLKEGVPPEGDDSEMSDRKMEFWGPNVRTDAGASRLEGGNER